MTVHPLPRESADRCALRAQLRGDAMLGTAFPAPRVLLVEQPGPWGRAGLAESRFDSSVARQLIGTAGNQGVRVLAIRRPGRTPRSATRRWALADCRPGQETLSWGTFGTEAELLELDLDAPGGVPDDSPAYLVCAHSRHDTCCALRGRPVAAALEQARPGRAWECSHVGGERFAANVLVLPFGLLYGRVLPFAATEFAAATDRGEVVGALLRGRIGHAPAAQAALAFAHTHLALVGVRELAVDSARRVSPAEWSVRLRTPHGPMDVTVEVEQAPAHHLTCHAETASGFLVYRPTTITPA